MPKAHIVLVPGFWEGPHIYSEVVPILKHHNYEVTQISLPSTGQAASTSPDKSGPSMEDDIAAIREIISQLVEEGKKLLIVGHSAGAFLAAGAVKGLSEKEQVAVGKIGGVSKFAFVTGALFPPGYTHSPAPFMEVEGDRMYCKSPRQILFNDLSDAEAEEQVKKLTSQPGSGWDGTVEYAGWQDIASGYLICEKDAAIPSEIQKQISGMMSASPVETCDAGHCAPITQPKRVADFIVNCAQGVGS